MKGGTLKNPLKAKGRLSLPFDSNGNQWGGFLNEFFKLPPHFVEIGATGLENINGRRVVEHRKKQVFNGNELMPLVIGRAECLIEGNLKFFAKHD